MIVDVDVMVLSRDGLLDKRFCHDLIANPDCILVNHLKLGHDPVFHNADATEFEFLPDIGIQSRTAITIHDKSSWGLDANLLQDLQDGSSIPENGLQIDLVHTKGRAELDIFDGLAKWESLGEEGDEKVTRWPCLDIYCSRREKGRET